MKIRQRWQFLISLAIPVLLMQGCAYAPGMQLKAGPGFFTFTRLTEPVEEDDYILVPVTRHVVESLELEHLKAESLTAESKFRQNGSSIRKTMTTMWVSRISFRL